MSKKKRKQITCYCTNCNYDFPHRWKSGNCKANKPVEKWNAGVSEEYLQDFENWYREVLEENEIPKSNS